MTLRNAFENIATDAELQGLRADVGTDGTTPPVIAGTGVRGWLRAIYERLTGGVAVTGAVAVENFPSTAASDATLAALADLNETMIYLTHSILEKMPRVDTNDRMTVNIEAGTLPTVSYVTQVGTVIDQTNFGGRSAAYTAGAMANAGAMYLYNNIMVT